MNPRLRRAAGLLLHPTSLPGPYGIGDIGPAAFAWIDILARARQSWWQILPLGPTGYGDSPYQCFSAFAGNVFLLSPDQLIRDGLISAYDVAGQYFPDDRVDYGRVIPFKNELASPSLAELSRRTSALDARALRSLLFGKSRVARRFCAVHGAEGRSPRGQLDHLAARTDADGRRRQAPRVHSARTERRSRPASIRAIPFLSAVAGACASMPTPATSRIIGDVPIFVSGDSADVWANPKLFLLDAAMRPKVVAGVPPDYFSPTGQLWGNPLYDWKAMKATQYKWWVDRMRATMQMVDLVRIDHFRGFCAAWHIPFGETTAVNGRWVEGPGRRSFQPFANRTGRLAVDCRGPRRNHARRIRTARPPAIARHESAAIRLRRSEQSVLAAQLSDPELGCLYGHARQRHNARLVQNVAGPRTLVFEPLFSSRRQLTSPGTSSASVGVRRQAWPWLRCRTFSI